MLQPKTDRGRRTRERILEAAAALMHVRGVHGTCLDDVLTASGTGKSQLYHYFRDKNELVRGVLALQTQRLLDQQEALFARLDSWEGIEAWLDAVVETHKSRGLVGGCPIGTLAAEMADQDPQLRCELAAALGIWRDRLAAGLQAMKERGELRSDADPRTLAELVVAVQQGATLLAKAEKDPRPLVDAQGHALAYLRSFAAGSS